MSILGPRAKDINVPIADFCLILGYLCSPNRGCLIEAQIPEEKAFIFEREFPGEPYYSITQGETTGGNIMKQGCQLRIYLLNIENCPIALQPHLTSGTGRFIRRINRGLFIEKIVKHYCFSFGDHQDVTAIRNAVSNLHPANLIDFERGYNL